MFELGYTFVDAGWAGDIVTTETRLGAELPVALEPDGEPVVSRIRIQYSSDGYTLPLKGNNRFVSYATADTDTTRSLLTVGDGIGGARVPVAPTAGRSGGARPDGCHWSRPLPTSACSTASIRQGSMS